MQIVNINMKPKDFLMFSEGRKRVHWEQMGKCFMKKFCFYAVNKY